MPEPYGLTFEVWQKIRQQQPVDKELEDARRAVASLGLPIPTDFRSPVEGLRLMVDLVRLLTCFPETDGKLGELAALLYPQNAEGGGQ
jgi:hypothetical protein